MEPIAVDVKLIVNPNATFTDKDTHQVKTYTAYSFQYKGETIRIKVNPADKSLFEHLIKVK